MALPKEVEGDAVLPVSCRIIRTEGRSVLGQKIRDGKWVVHLGKGASAKIVAGE